MIRVIKQEDITKEDYPKGLIPVEDFNEAVEKLIKLSEEKGDTEWILDTGSFYNYQFKKDLNEIFGDLK